MKASKDDINKIVESQIFIDGLIGIAHGSDRSDVAKDAAALLLDPFDSKRIEKLQFREKVELLNGICLSDLLEYIPSKRKAQAVVD